jgi:hypothetical protein
LIWWDVQLWDEFIALLKETRRCCVANDANVRFFGEPKDTLDGVADYESDSMFNRELRQLVTYCEVHKAISPVRIALELQTYADDDRNSALVVDATQLGMVL